MGKNFFIEDPKASFIVGIAAGVGVLSVIGFLILLTNFLGDGEGSSKTAKNTNTGAANPQPTAQVPTPSIDPANIPITDADQIRGNEDADITIVEFSDYECPFCSRFHPSLVRALDEYDGDVRWVYKHFPLDSIHPQARPAANAAECAGEQGKFWEYSDALFANQALLSDSYFRQLAGELGMNTGDFNNCIDTNKYAEKVNTDYQLGVSLGVRGTPTSFINGIELNGAQPYEAVAAAIENLR